MGEATRRQAKPLDSDFVRAAEKAVFVISEAEALGIDFSIEGGQLAVGFPLDIEPGAWASFQRAITDNLRFIAHLTLLRAER